MGVITDPRYPKDPQELPRKQKREPRMCNPQQQSPPQNAAWQGVYPDLSALNELFPLNKPLQQAQDSPPHGLASWLPLVCNLSQEARTSLSSNNKQDLSRKNPLLLQHLRLRDKRVTPMLEQTLQLGVNLNTKHLQEHPNDLEV